MMNSLVQTEKGPPVSWLPVSAAEIALAVILGLAASLVTVSAPMIGMAAVGGLALYFAATRRVEIPLALLVFSFAIPVQKTVAGIPVNMSDGVLVLWGASWPFLMMREDSPKFRLPFVFWAALPFVISAFISQFVAYNPPAAFKQAIRLVEWFSVLPILFAAVRPTQKFWNVMIAVFLIVPPLFALDGIVEFFNHGRSLSHMLGIPVPIPPKELSAIRHTFDVSGRAGSTFGGAQGLAMYLAMMMSVIVGIIIQPPTPLIRVLGVVSIAICFAGLYVAKSRGGLLGVCVMFTVIMLLYRPKVGYGILVGGLFAVFSAVLWLFFWHGWNGTIQGLVPGRPEAVLDRLIIWNRAFHIWMEHPVIGVGFGNFHDVVYQTGGIHLNVGLGYLSLHCHNTYLEVLTDLGLVGFVAYLSFLVLCLTKLVRGWRRRSNRFPDCFMLSAIGAMSAYMMFAMVDMLFVQNMHFILVTLISLGMLAIRPVEETRAHAQAAPAQKQGEDADADRQDR